MKQDWIIQTKNLTKQYNGKGGIRNISLDVPRGTVFGFIGPNGAGKSTFVRTMLGLIHPGFWNGANVRTADWDNRIKTVYWLFT